MILITKLPTGILIQRDDTEIIVEAAAINSALPSIIGSLTGCDRATGQARREGYEAGLERGREQATIEHETSMRIAERQADELVQALAGLSGLTSAA